MASEYLYAVQFSDGLTKVGRSKTAEARVAQHAARLAVAGLQIADSHVELCLGNARVAESSLIARCTAAATGRRHSEWFVGLDFELVKVWLADACAEAAHQPVSVASDCQYVTRLSGFPIPVEGAYICRACSRHFSTRAAPSAFVCGQCAALGYSFRQKPLALELDGTGVPLWHAAIGASDVIDLGAVVMCEELRPDVPWLRLRDARWARGRPVIDYSATPKNSAPPIAPADSPAQEAA